MFGLCSALPYLFRKIRLLLTLGCGGLLPGGKVGGGDRRRSIGAEGRPRRPQECAKERILLKDAAGLRIGRSVCLSVPPRNVAKGEKPRKTGLFALPRRYDRTRYVLRRGSRSPAPAGSAVARPAASSFLQWLRPGRSARLGGAAGRLSGFVSWSAWSFFGGGLLCAAFARPSGLSPGPGERRRGLCSPFVVSASLGCWRSCRASAFVRPGGGCGAWERLAAALIVAQAEGQQGAPVGKRAVSQPRRLLLASAAIGAGERPPKAEGG